MIKNILGKLCIILDIDGTLASPILVNLIGRSLACKNIFTDTLVVHITRDSLMMYQIHYVTKHWMDGWMDRWMDGWIIT